MRSNCRHPRLLSSTPTAVLGHESGWSPDGLTFYASSTGGQTLVALDLTDPTAPKPIFEQAGVNYHGMRVSRGRPDRSTSPTSATPSTGARFSSGGLRILDVSEIQDRKPNPQVHIIKDLTWPEHSIPQVPQPFTRNGRDYLLEVDEYANYSLTAGADQAKAPVGAARIIDVTDPQHRRSSPTCGSRCTSRPPARGPRRTTPGRTSRCRGTPGTTARCRTRRTRRSWPAR